MTRERAAIAAALLFALVIGILEVHDAVRARVLMGDFRAFYCAGQIAAEHGDPYAGDDLARCEHEAAPEHFFSPQPTLVVPAPLPGYLVAAFVPLGILPLPLAAIVFSLASLIATALGAWCLVRLRWTSTACVIVATALPVLALSFCFGQLPPFTFAGVALTAWAMGTGRPRWCALGVVLAMAAPQLGVPLALAAIVSDRRTWGTMIAAFAGLGALSLLVVGLAHNIEFMRDVLPAHIASEVPSMKQYSLSWALHQFGWSDAAARAGGQISYLVMVGLGAVVAWILARRGESAAACAMAPTLALIGGPFVHLAHMLAAIPAALWLAERTRPHAIGTAPLIALALPIPILFSDPLHVLAIPVIAGWIAYAYVERQAIALRAAAGAICASALLAVLLSHSGLKPGTPVTASATGSATGSINAQTSLSLIHI